jgi:hypothetical protein
MEIGTNCIEKRDGKWAAKYITLLFNRNKMVPIQPGKSFDDPEEKVTKYPNGYKCFARVEDKAGRPPKMDLNAHGPEWDILYKKCKDWLEGKVVMPNLTAMMLWTIDKLFCFNWIKLLGDKSDTHTNELDVAYHCKFNAETCLVQVVVQLEIPCS